MFHGFLERSKAWAATIVMLAVRRFDPDENKHQNFFPTHWEKTYFLMVWQGRSSRPLGRRCERLVDGIGRSGFGTLGQRANFY
jgi:hypothetical protein